MMDNLLITQIKCQLIIHQLTCPSMDNLWEDDGPKPPSMAVAAALLRQVEGLRESLLPPLRSESQSMPLYTKIRSLINTLQELRSFTSIVRSLQSRQWH